MSENQLLAAIAPSVPGLVAIRRDIHAHPELGLEEHRTAALVADKLRSWGIETTTGIGKTGVVGTIKGNRPGNRSVGLRADMDALAIIEQTGLPYASKAVGNMHACGHDGHTTMLLGAAKYLAANRDFAGTVQLIFQPAEEGRGGAIAMLADGLFERFPVDAVYGMHNSAGLPVGKFQIRKGPALAGGGRWSVRFTGNGGHGGSKPHLAADLSVALAYFILGLQTIVGRNVPALEAAVISVGHISHGSSEATNVMPADLTVAGTARYFVPQVRETIERRLREMAIQFAELQGGKAEVDLHWGAVPMVNHAEQVDICAAAAANLVAQEAVNTNGPASTGGEDFAFMLQQKPGAMIGIGNGVAADGSFHGLHTPKYDFNDEIIPLGVAYWVELVQQELKVA